jgi:hypothetical protein
MDRVIFHSKRLEKEDRMLKGLDRVSGRWGEASIIRGTQVSAGQF